MSHYHLTFVMDERTKEQQGGVVWHMLLADDIVMTDEIRDNIIFVTLVLKHNYTRDI